MLGSRIAPAVEGVLRISPAEPRASKHQRETAVIRFAHMPLCTSAQKKLVFYFPLLSTSPVEENRNQRKLPIRSLSLSLSLSLYLSGFLSLSWRPVTRVTVVKQIHDFTSWGSTPSLALGMLDLRIL